MSDEIPILQSRKKSILKLLILINTREMLCLILFAERKHTLSLKIRIINTTQFSNEKCMPVTLMIIKLYYYQSILYILCLTYIKPKLHWLENKQKHLVASDLASIYLYLRFLPTLPTYLFVLYILIIIGCSQQWFMFNALFEIKKLHPINLLRFK